MLRLVLPKGSLEKATLELFEAADLPVTRSSSVDYQGTIDDPRIASVRILRPQEIPMLRGGRAVRHRHHRARLGRGDRQRRRQPRRTEVLEGDRAGRSSSSSPSPATRRPSRSTDLPDGVRVQSEYPELTKRFFAEHGVQRRRAPVVRSDRGEDPRHRRLRRGDHRDRPRPAGRRPQGDRHDPHELHRGRRQRRRRPPTPTSARRWTR